MKILLGVCAIAILGLSACQPSPPTSSEAPPQTEAASPTDIEPATEGEGEPPAPVAVDTSDRFQAMPGTPDCIVPDELASNKYVGYASEIPLNTVRDSAVGFMSRDADSMEGENPEYLRWNITTEAGTAEIRMAFIGGALVDQPRLTATVGNRECYWKILPKPQ